MSEKCFQHGEDEAPWMCDCTREKLSKLESQLAFERTTSDYLAAVLRGNGDYESAAKRYNASLDNPTQGLPPRCQLTALRAENEKLMNVVKAARGYKCEHCRGNPMVKEHDSLCVALSGIKI